MFKTSVLDFLPLWAIFLGSTALIVLSIEAGFALGRRRVRAMKDGEAPHVGGAVAATLGLLAFMLAFTFGSGTSRWDAKRTLVLDESNAIGTAYLRTDLLPEPQRSISQQLLMDYIDLRLVVANNHTEELEDKKVKNLSRYAQNIAAIIRESKALHSQLWGQATSAAQQQPSPLTALYVGALNDVIDLHQKRVTVSMQQRMPMVFWVTLYSLAVLSMGLAGYDAGASRSARSGSSLIVALAFSSVLLLVVALDRPQSSSVEQTALLELQQDIHAARKAL
jgi:hypothetical protein